MWVYPRAAFPLGRYGLGILLIPRPPSLQEVPAPAWILCRPWSLRVVCLLHCRALLLPWPFHYLSSSLCSFFLSSHFCCVPSPCPGVSALGYFSTEAPHRCLMGSALPSDGSLVELPGTGQGNPWSLPREATLLPKP